MTETVVYTGNFIAIKLASVTIADREHIREIIHENGEGVVVVAVRPDKSVLLVRQERYGLGVTHELPAGAVKTGETPLAAAHRELLEETGYVAREMRLISSHINGVHMVGYNHFYIAGGLSYRGGGNHDEDELIHAADFFSEHQIDAFIDDGSIPDLRNRAALWLARLKLADPKKGE